MDTFKKIPPRILGSYGAGLFLGALTDFIFNGVLKIRTLPLNITLYCGFALVLGAQLAPRAQWGKPNTWVVSAIFLVGTVLGHLLLVNRDRVVIYQATLLAKAPLTFAFPGSPKRLMIESEKINSMIGNHVPGDTFALTLTLTTDYGCIWTSRIDYVEEIDIRSDADSSWAWHTDKYAPPAVTGPLTEDRRLPWCRVKNTWEWWD